MRTTQTSGIAHLGALRFILATAVAMFHVWTPVAPDAGRHAVVGFFMISGFLITKITRESYPNHPVAFIANRALRIYPQFIAACLITLLMDMLFPVIASGTYLVSFAPKSLPEWIGQLSFATVGVYKPFMPQTWSMNVEIVFYFIIGLLSHDSIKLTISLFIFGLIAAFLCFLKIIPYSFYFSPQSDAFMFFAGSLAYFYASRYRMPSFFLIPAFCLYGISMFVLPLFMNIGDYYGPIPHTFLLTSLTCTFVILVVMQQSWVDRGQLTKVSAYLGRLSYPIFLLHWAVAMPFASLFNNDKTLVFLASYPALILVSILMVQLIDRPVERLRSVVRGAATPPMGERPYEADRVSGPPETRSRQPAQLHAASSAPGLGLGPGAPAQGLAIEAPSLLSANGLTSAILAAVVSAVFVWPLSVLLIGRGVFDPNTYRCPEALRDKADLYFGTQPLAGHPKGCARALGNGTWFTPEALGVWGAGRYSNLALVGRNWGRKTVHIDLHLTSYTGMGFGTGSQTVIVRVRGVVLARQALHPGMTDQVVPLILPLASRDAPDRVVLDFETVPPISPSQVGGPKADTRSLGVFLHGLQIRARADRR